MESSTPGERAASKENVRSQRWAGLAIREPAPGLKQAYQGQGRDAPEEKSECMGTEKGDSRTISIE